MSTTPVRRPGPRGQRTRASLLGAAIELFAERGYLDTTVGQIAEQAGVSLGTFYIYFRDRADVVRSLILDHAAVMHERTEGGWRVHGGFPSLHRLIGAFVAAYAEQARFAAVWEQICHVDPELATMRRELGRVFTAGVERELSRGSRAGLTRRFSPGEASLAARALTGMVDRYCYGAYVFDPPAGGPPAVEDSAQMLAELWASAVGLSR